MPSATRSVWLLVGVAATGVGLAVALRTPALATRYWLLRGRPPDAVPAWTAHDTSYAGPWLKNVLQVAFREDAPRAQRAAALDRVSGTIIGGLPLPPAGGLYLVHVPADGVGPQFRAAAATLRAQPAVEVVAEVVRPDTAARGGVRHEP